MDRDTNDLLREMIELQREQLAEYRRVTAEQLELQRDSVQRQKHIGRSYRVGVVLYVGMLVVVVYMIASRMVQ